MNTYVFNSLHIDTLPTSEDNVVEALMQLLPLGYAHQCMHVYDKQIL